MNNGSHTIAALYGMIAGAFFVFAANVIGLLAYMAMMNP